MPTPQASPLGFGASLALRPLRFLQETALRRPPAPAWHSPSRILWETDALRLRDFGGARDPSAARPAEHRPSAARPAALRPTALRPGADRPAAQVPVLLVPPEVNRSFIVDFGPGQSLVQAIHEAGFARVAAVDWKSATRDTASRDIDESVADIHEAIARLGGRVHLIGVCQGGWESAIAAALRPEAVASLTLVAAPIDFHAGEGVLKHLTRALPMAAYQGLVALGGARMPGDFISFGFDAMMPFERFFLKPLAVWNHLDDAAWMARYGALQDWYKAPKDLPGRLYLRAVRELFKENRLVRGRLRVAGQRVSLARITCPLCLVAGQRDHITPPPQLLGARRHFGATQVREVLTDGGHIGTFMGRRELAEHWPPLLAWILEQGA